MLNGMIDSWAEMLDSVRTKKDDKLNMCVTCEKNIVDRLNLFHVTIFF